MNQKGLLQEGNYDYAFSTSRVMGHWRPLKGSSPYQGNEGSISEEMEIKMEFRIHCEKREVTEAIIREVHPYEVPVISFFKLY